MPGVKSIDVSFKGGLRTLREATISWTCWSWEDLNSLMSHFLAHGKTVMVEWGWVYNKETLTQLPNFWKTDVAGNKSIDASAFTNYKNKVLYYLSKKNLKKVGIMKTNFYDNFVIPLLEGDNENISLVWHVLIFQIWYMKFFRKTK